MKIGVIGQSKNTVPAIEKKAKEIGKEIAISDHILVTGGCRGYPFDAAIGAQDAKGMTIAISPAKDKEEHLDKYGFPLEQTEIIYTGLGIPDRNKEVVLNSDIVIMIAGTTGTLNEFTFALYEKKPLGVLIGSGGVSDIAKKMVKACKYDGIVVYSDSPKVLVKNLIAHCKQ